jgi:PAS domain S-box-containing protein
MSGVPARTVLIVGDASVAGTLARTVAGFGYNVSTTRSARAALSLDSAGAPELVLLDSDGGGPGVRDAGELYWKWRVPVVVAGADPADETHSGLGSSLVPVLPSPYTDRELRTTIELALCRHDATRQIHELEDRFFAISIDMLCFLGFDGYFRRLNPAWERTLGYTREELMSRRFVDFVHPDDRERTLRQNAAVRAGGQALEFENRYMCKDGSYRWFLWNAAPDAAEQVIYSVARDVTARKEADAERERLVRELQDALGEVRSLQEILPICSYCKRIRDDENYWHVVESYFARHANTRFSHSICPSCYTKEVQPQLDEMDRL